MNYLTFVSSRGMEESVRLRLRTFVKTKGIGIVATEIGYKQSTFSNKLSGERGIELELITGLLEHYPGLSAEWLLRGVGPMEYNSSSSDTELQAVCIDQAKEIYRLKLRVAELEGEKKDRA